MRRALVLGVLLAVGVFVWSLLTAVSGLTRTFAHVSPPRPGVRSSDPRHGAAEPFAQR